MATVLQIVTRALRKAGVAAHDETPTADEVTNATDALNAMIHAFKLEGVDFTWTDQDAADTFALDDEYHEGTVYLLASRLSPDYTLPLTFDADNWFRSFQANEITPPTATVPSALTSLVAGRRRGTTYSGT